MASNSIRVHSEIFVALINYKETKGNQRRDSTGYYINAIY